MTGPAASNSDSRPEQRPTRVEDADLLRGRGRFADDLPEPRGVLHTAILRSPHGHAELVSIDYVESGESSSNWVLVTDNTDFIERPEIGRELLADIAGQKSEAFSGFDRGALKASRASLIS